MKIEQGKKQNEKVSDDFMKTLTIKGRGKSTALVLEVSKLNPGEHLFISKEEWAETHFKSDPANLVVANSFNPRSSLSGYRFSRKTAVEGWVITRVK